DAGPRCEDLPPPRPLAPGDDRGVDRDAGTTGPGPEGARMTTNNRDGRVGRPDAPPGGAAAGGGQRSATSGARAQADPGGEAGPGSRGAGPTRAPTAGDRPAGAVGAQRDPQDRTPTPLYSVEAGRICRSIRDGDKELWLPVCNFRARIVREIVRD